MRALHFLAGIFLSVLPERYRRWYEPASTEDFRRAAFLSGLAQFLISLGLIIARYLTFFQERVLQMGGEVIARGSEEALGARSVQWGIGFFATFEYLLQPLTLLLIYFSVEGAVRFCAAAFTEEVLGTLPLHVASALHGRAARAQAERALGPLVVDTVERGNGKEFDLRISSCRPKENWDRLMTVAYEDVFYEVASQREGRPPLQGEPSGRARRFVYLLRKIPEGKIIRGLHHYRSDEVLPKEKK